MVLETWCLGMNDRYVQCSTAVTFTVPTPKFLTESTCIYILIYHNYQPSTGPNIFPVLGRVPDKFFPSNT